MQKEITTFLSDSNPVFVRNQPFFSVQLVKFPCLGYKAGYNYTDFPKKSDVIISFSRKNVEIDTLFFYEFCGSGLKFNRVQISKLLQYSVFGIDLNYLNQLIYEIQK